MLIKQTKRQQKQTWHIRLPRGDKKIKIADKKPPTINKHLKHPYDPIFLLKKKALRWIEQGPRRLIHQAILIDQTSQVNLETKAKTPRRIITKIGQKELIACG